MGNTNERFVKDLNRLVKVRNKQESSLPTVEAAPIAMVRSVGTTTEPSKVEPEGISSPLREIPGRREYYSPKLVKSSDGLFVIEQQQVKSAVFLDAVGNEIILEFV